MEDETTVPVDFSYDPEKNYDEATMVQQRQIEKQIADEQPLVSERLSFDQLTKEYMEEDQIYQRKIEDLKIRYQFYRRTRGDGNCFFRAFGFAFLESLLKDGSDLKRFKDVVTKSRDNLVELGFPQFTIDDFHENFMDVVDKVENGCTLQELVETFNSQGLSDYLVVYLRLLVSGHLQKEHEFFQNFMEGGKTVKEFCNQEVEPMGKESDHIHIIALTSSLGVGVCIEYMDRGEGEKVIRHQFPEDSTPVVSLLYKPGHYDVLYV